MSPLNGDLHEDMGRQKGLLSHIFTHHNVIKEGILGLLFAVIAASVAGLFLSSFREMLLLLPGLIMIVPGAINMRGTIYGSLSSRLCSAFHLGTIERFKWGDPLLKENTHTSFLQGAFLSVVLACFAKLVSIFLGIETISIFSFVLISFLGSMLAGVLLLAATYFVAFAAYHHGWNPDNVTVPIITSLGDVLTIPCILLAAFVVMKLPFLREASIGLLAFLFISFAFIIYRERVRESLLMKTLPILLLCAGFSVFSGLQLEYKLAQLAIVPVFLLMVPAFLGQGGNIGGIFAVRLSAALHTGLLPSDYKLSKELVHEIISAYFLAFFAFPLVGVLTYFVSNIAGISGASFLSMVGVSLLAGLLLVTIVLVYTSILSLYLFRHADLDNFMVPIVTSTADIVGVLCLLVVLILSGII